MREDEPTEGERSSSDADQDATESIESISDDDYTALVIKRIAG